MDIPILRAGGAYPSLDTAPIRDLVTGEELGRLSLANPGLIRRDIARAHQEIDRLREHTVPELMAAVTRAGEIFRDGTVETATGPQDPDRFRHLLSRTGGMPLRLCRENMVKLASTMTRLPEILDGLTRGLDPRVMDRGYGVEAGRPVGFQATARSLGAVLPVNSPGIHALWIPALAFRAALFLRPGRSEPWTGNRILGSLLQAGYPGSRLGYYPSGPAGSEAILQGCDRSLLFGDGATTRPYRNRPEVQIHGPGFSKVLIGPDRIDRFEDALDLLVDSVAANGGRSCINASTIVVPARAKEVAEALAARLQGIVPLPLEDPEARLAAFADPAAAERADRLINGLLAAPGARDACAPMRGPDRLVQLGRLVFLLPTVIHCEDPEHPLARREFMFPFCSVVEVEPARTAGWIGPTLAATVLSEDPAFLRGFMESPMIDRLNLGAIPTHRVSFSQPHEGNLFDHMFRRRAVQREPEMPA